MSRERNLYLNGSLVLGQETDIFNGDFNDMQSYSGDIYDFRWGFDYNNSFCF